MYALIALGIVLIMKSSAVFNFAQGDFVMLGGYLGWTFAISMGIPPIPSLIGALVVMGLLGFAIQRATIRPLIGQPLIASVIMTLGLSYTLKGVAQATWSNLPQEGFALFPTTSLRLGGASVSWALVGGFIVAMVSFGILVLLFQRTRIGLSMRATAEDSQLAQSTGISVNRVLGWVWALAAIGGGLGGILLGSVSTVSSSLSQTVLAVIPAILLGGLESVPGAVVGGLVVGVLQSIGAGYLDPLVGGGSREVLPFVVLMIILMTKPHGLFGLKRIERI